MLYADLPIKTRIERARSQSMRHPSFCLLSGVMMIGRVHINDTIPTACTDGIDTFYGTGFVAGLTEEQTNFLVLHEEGHKAFNQLPMYKHLYKLDGRRANMACDYVINGWIIDTDPQGSFAKPPKGALYKPEWSDLTVKQIFDLLGDEQEQEQGKGQGTGDDGSLDSHDWETADKLTEEQAEQLGKEIEAALREGTTLVGKLKGNIDRRMTDILQPKIDWRDVLRDFVNTIASGKDQSSWRQFNRRYVSQDLYLPSTVSESMGEVVIGIDTSGSISQDQLSVVTGELVSICKSVNPLRIRVLFWDTHVAKEQVFEGDKSNVVHSLRPAGGGGTRASCVSDYILERGYNPEAIIMFTDGYLEAQVFWLVNQPTIWIVNGNQSFQAPRGGIVVKY
jgi:predicted metal-dependent peptidase